MRLTQLKLENFKNYDSLNIKLGEHLTCIVGLNGSGKTNLLDAIHYLVFTKSGFATGDPMNIKKSRPYFLIKGQFEEGNQSSEITCYLERGQKKVFKKNKVTYEKLSDHIGQLLCVMSTPYDTEIIRGASDIRRKWIDGCISQFHPAYLKELISYQRYLKQRNALLKQLDGKMTAKAESLLDTYDDQIIPLAISVSTMRRDFLAAFVPYFKSNLRIFVKDHESCTISLKSKVLEPDFQQKFKVNRAKDVLLQRTSLGSHKDDFSFLLGDEPIKQFGSQGQQKSFLISLKLAQYDHLVASTGRHPILLLDDVFDKLDEERISQLLKLLTQDFEQNDQIVLKGQVLITDARTDRTRELTKNIPNTQLLEIEHGNLV